MKIWIKLLSALIAAILIIALYVSTARAVSNWIVGVGGIPLTSLYQEYYYCGVDAECDVFDTSVTSTTASSGSDFAFDVCFDLPGELNHVSYVQHDGDSGGAIKYLQLYNELIGPTLVYSHSQNFGFSWTESISVDNVRFLCLGIPSGPDGDSSNFNVKVEGYSYDDWTPTPETTPTSTNTPTATTTSTATPTFPFPFPTSEYNTGIPGGVFPYPTGSVTPGGFVTPSSGTATPVTVPVYPTAGYFPTYPPGLDTPVPGGSSCGGPSNPCIVITPYTAPTPTANIPVAAPAPFGSRGSGVVNIPNIVYFELIFSDFGCPINFTDEKLGSYRICITYTEQRNLVLYDQISLPLSAIVTALLIVAIIIAIRMR